jgi:hypothetical protein
MIGLMEMHTVYVHPNDGETALKNTVIHQTATPARHAPENEFSHRSNFILYPSLRKSPIE